MSEIDLHVTNLCNFNCQHCIYSSGAKFKDELNTVELLNIIKNISEIGIEEVHFTGGEPILRNDVIKAIRFASKLGMETRIQTNGWFMSWKKIKSLENAHVDTVLVSIDGERDFHDSFRCKSGAFDYALSAVKNLTHTNMKVRVNTVVFKQNKESALKLLTQLHELDIDEHSFFYLTPEGRGRQFVNQILSLNEWVYFLESLRSKCRDLSISYKVRVEEVFNLKSGISKKKCRVLDHDYHLIMANGDVYPCVLLLSHQFKMGNIRKKSLESILNSHSIIDDLITNRNVKECFNCDVYNKCGGGCPGYSNMVYRDIVHKDIRCKPLSTYYPTCIRRYVSIN